METIKLVYPVDGGDLIEAGEASSKMKLTLKKLGLRLRRFKTGTPARVLRSSIDFTDLEVQEGDESVVFPKRRTRVRLIS